MAEPGVRCGKQPGRIPLQPAVGDYESLVNTTPQTAFDDEDDDDERRGRP
jgi:hypothetical protein